MDMTTVCCKLPCGIILDHPNDPSKKIALHGRNRAMLVGQEYGTTEVDSSAWDAWYAAHSGSKLLQSGAVFAAKNAKTLEKMVEDFVDRKTGFEPTPQDGMGVQTMGA